MVSHLRVFFERELCGVFSWSQVMLGAPEKTSAKIWPGDRPSATISFGDYAMRVVAPEDEPPLGRIEVFAPGFAVEGPLQPSTWVRAGAEIRDRENGRMSNV